jgi:Mg2+/Co2+ transporter CorB
VALEIAVVVALMVLNGLFAMSETAMVSARRARLKERPGGRSGARAALDYLDLLPPTQLVLPLAGFLVGQGRFSFVPVLAAVVGGSPGSCGAGGEHADNLGAQ